MRSQASVTGAARFLTMAIVGMSVSVGKASTVYFLGVVALKTTRREERTNLSLGYEIKGRS